MNLAVIAILFVCAALIALADAFIKLAAHSGSFVAALKSPWIYWSVVLYLIQILLVAYLFLKKLDLGILANAFLIFYSVMTLALGYWMFQEKLNVTQALGILLGIIGVFLMTK